jgi:hypothetical protein
VDSSNLNTSNQNVSNDDEIDENEEHIDNELAKNKIRSSKGVDNSNQMGNTVSTQMNEDLLATQSLENTKNKDETKSDKNCILF